MNADPQNVRSIFLAAVENHAPDQWSAYLDGACGPDQELRQRVEVLLRAHEQANSLLDAPAPMLAATIDAPAPAERPGTVIGPYKLLQQIGEGGMGTVFMAEQTHPVQRKVALKVIKAGMDSRQVIARFEAERQALAMMDHVNIARVLDAGTIDRRPHAPREESLTRSVRPTVGPSRKRKKWEPVPLFGLLAARARRARRRQSSDRRTLRRRPLSPSNQQTLDQFQLTLIRSPRCTEAASGSLQHNSKSPSRRRAQRSPP